MADGDGRAALTLAEEVWRAARKDETFGAAQLQAIVQRRAPIYDKSQDGHYNLISALHKSVRGSDPDAALYYLARMLDAGEPPLYIARRVVRMAIEDIGMADPQALVIANAAKEAYDFLGSPEGELALAQAVIYVATAPKSNAAYTAYGAAMRVAKEAGSLLPPKHILNAPTKSDEGRRLRPRLRLRPRRRGGLLRPELFPRRAAAPAVLRSARARLRARDPEAAGVLGEAAEGAGPLVRRGKNGPRQPGGGRQQPGPRPLSRQAQSAPAPPRVAKRSGGEGSGVAGHSRKAQRPPTPAASPPTLPTARESSRGEASGVQTVTVTPDESGMRVDRFFEARFPGLSFSHIQRIIRKGEVRVNGKRTQPKARLEAGQAVRIPPLKLDAPKPRDDAPQAQKDRAFIKSITLYEDADVLVLNKPMGLAVQGGSGTVRHIDGMLGALRGPGPDAQRPRLVHRLDKDTAGCLLVAKTRFAAAALAKTFRTRAARKIYWALVAGVPKPKQGRVSTYLAKQEVEEDSYMRIAKHGDKDAMHAVTYYAVVETAAQKLSWISLKPVTGRTHQLRAHMAHVGNPIVGDPKYFNIENWEFPGGIQKVLHLLARRIAVPHPRGGVIDVSAPLPPHMQQSWNLLGFDAKRYDPIEEAPEE